MTKTSGTKRAFFAAALSLAVLGITTSPNVAVADGINPSSTGPVCKGKGPCNTLAAKCKGKYVDATDSEGTVYGKCYPKSAAIQPKLKQFKTKTAPKQKTFKAQRVQ